MERRTFLHLAAGTAGAMLVPVFGNAIAAEELQSSMPLSLKKALDRKSTRLNSSHT